MALKKKSKLKPLWRPLVEGDIVDLVAPGSSCTEEALQGGIEFLKSWGLKPRCPYDIFGKDVICANDDETRFLQLKTALMAKDSKAIWCVRGGYGSNRLVPKLAKLKAPSFGPKLFVGLSDISTLHTFLNQNWKWPTVHGPLLDRLGKKAALPEWEAELKRVLFGEQKEIAFTKLKPMNKAAQKKGELKGMVTGGNLIVLQSTLGTSAEWKPKDQIVFFEEIGERGYRVDRVLEQFRQAGAFDRAKAIVFGDFTEGLEPDGSSRIPAILERFASLMKIPVLSGVETGHDVVQRPLPFGTPSVLKLGSFPTLTCQSGVNS